MKSMHKENYNNDQMRRYAYLEKEIMQFNEHPFIIRL